MQVFKLCMQILRKNLLIMLVYVFVFVLASMIMSSNMTQEMTTAFSPTKANIAFICEENSTLIDGFKEELSHIAKFADLPDETEALQDALFFRSVSYILRVPKGFTEGFMNGEDIALEKTVVPDSLSNTYIDLYIEKYFNTARLYVSTIEGISEQELVDYLKADLAKNAEVTLKTTERKSSSIGDAHYYFNYLSYSLLSVIILGMSTLMLVFHRRDLKLRNNCSPVSATSINLQFILANLTFTLGAWALMIVLCLMVNVKHIFSPYMAYFILNSLVFAFCCAGISFLIGNLVKSENAVPAICNVVGLGFSFISGAFVPQELLGATVIKIASFTPAYWFVKANNTIVRLTQFDFPSVKPVLSDMLVVLCFAVAFFAVALAVGKKRKYA